MQFIFNIAIEEFYDLKHTYVGSEHILLGLLRSRNNISYMLIDYGLTYEHFKEKVINAFGYGKERPCKIAYTPIYNKIIQKCLARSKVSSKNHIKPLDILLSLLEEKESIAFRLMISLDVDVDKMYADLIK